MPSAKWTRFSRPLRPYRLSNWASAPATLSKCTLPIYIRLPDHSRAFRGFPCPVARSTANCRSACKSSARPLAKRASCNSPTPSSKPAAPRSSTARAAKSVLRACKNNHDLTRIHCEESGSRRARIPSRDRPGFPGPMENLHGGRSLVGRRSCVPFDHGRAAHCPPRRQALREPPDAPPFLKEIPSPHAPCGGAPHPAQNAYPARPCASLRKRRDARATPRSPRPYAGFHGSSRRERPGKIPHAPPLPRYLERLRVVPDDRLPPDSAHQATEGNRRGSTENCNNLAEVERCFPSCRVVSSFYYGSCADKACRTGRFFCTLAGKY